MVPFNSSYQGEGPQGLLIVNGGTVHLDRGVGYTRTLANDLESGDNCHSKLTEVATLKSTVRVTTNANSEEDLKGKGGDTNLL